MNVNLCFCDVNDKTNTLINSAEKLISSNNPSASHSYILFTPGITDHRNAADGRNILSVVITVGLFFIGSLLLIGSVFYDISETDKEIETLETRKSEWIQNKVYYSSSFQKRVDLIIEKASAILNAGQVEAKINMILSVGLIAGTVTLVAGVFFSSSFITFIGGAVIIGVAVNKVRTWIYSPYQSENVDAIHDAIYSLRNTFELPSGDTPLTDLALQNTPQNSPIVTPPTTD